MLNKIFLIADTHFNHKRIIEYCKRPFDSVEEMNETLIRNWNSKVSSDDIVIHVGDFGLGSFEELKSIFNRLNGIKYLVMGNHDLRGGSKFYRDLGFERVYKKEFQLGKYIFTHKPKEINEGYINIYGHIHNSLIPKGFDDDKHICVSVERIDYSPIELEELIKNKLAKKELKNKKHLFYLVDRDILDNLLLEYDEILTKETDENIRYFTLIKRDTIKEILSKSKESEISQEEK